MVNTIHCFLFWQNFNTEDCFDGTRLEYSINGGSWTTLGLSGDADGSQLVYAK
ncbi:MAG: hypothetical protein IPP38_01945 [Bacteroidetes bacterium]|nr:hypothetical protein [Bacteroidota bacterium]